MPTFILNDETVINSHGFLLLNSGGDFTRFDANPVMLFGHDAANILGRWVNRTISGSQLTADTEFDMDDADAAKRAGQVERGFLKGASIGLYIRDAEYRYCAATDKEELYVTKWEAIESSLTPTPSNAGALSLQIYDSKTELAIESSKVQSHIEGIIQLSINKNESMKVNLSAEALTALGLEENANPTEVSAKIVALNATLAALKAADKEKGEKITSLEASISEATEKAISQMVSLAITEGRALESQRATLTAFAKVDLEGCKSLLADKSAKPSITDSLEKITLGADRKDWSYFDWKAKDPTGLEALRGSDEKQYNEILKKLK